MEKLTGTHKSVLSSMASRVMVVAVAMCSAFTSDREEQHMLASAAVTTEELSTVTPDSCSSGDDDDGPPTIGPAMSSLLKSNKSSM